MDTIAHRDGVLPGPARLPRLRLLAVGLAVVKRGGATYVVERFADAN
jgi:hypothetical protein